ncbi:hypothetical protein [Paenibacillus sp. BK720]|uniref:hypothetical protein n=1 Tax=Paenibacillus sp. BK720 TaxID=2587092 RepID=UPI00141E4047|nr:hypothetical protein [Paenibacillus sp. BK720]NIK67945.1 hypothetical protein [Paenibacillus sp. BK720]
MATTPKKGLPLIDSSMTADIPRDYNALANGVDTAIGNHESAAVLPHPDGSVTDAKIGTRTIDDTVAAAAGADTPTRLWSKLANMIKAITGKGNWYTPPSTTIEALNTGKAPIANPTFTGNVTAGGDVIVTNDNTGVTLFGGAKVYKKMGAGLAFRRHSADVDPVVENNAGTSSWKIWHAGNGGAGSGMDADKVDGFDFDQALKTTSSATFAGMTVNGSINKRGAGDLVIYDQAGGSGLLGSLYHQSGALTIRADTSTGQATGPIDFKGSALRYNSKQLAVLDSPAFTGTPTVPTAAAGTNTTQAASTAFVRAAVAGIPAPDLSGYAPLDNPIFTGVVKVGDGTGRLEVTNYNGGLRFAAFGGTGNGAAFIHGPAGAGDDILQIIRNDTSNSNYTLQARAFQAAQFKSTMPQGTAPFTVVSTTTVTNLNADLLDGQHGAYYAPIANPNFTGTVNAPSVTAGALTVTGNASIAGNLIAKTIPTKGYKTTDSSNIYQNQWTKIATVTVTSQYSDYASKASIIGLGAGAAITAHCDLFFRVKQQNALGSDPFVELIVSDSSHANGFTGDSFAGIVSTMNATTTVVDLYIRNPLTYNGFFISPYQEQTSGGTTCTWLENQSYITTLPASVGSTFRSSYNPYLYTENNTLDDGAGNASFRTVASTVATGTAPFVVASTTVVPNLNADLLDGYQAGVNSAPTTVVVRDSSETVISKRFTANVAQGTAPLIVTSTTVVPNLNVDMVDGFHMDQDVRKAASPTFAAITTSGATVNGNLTVSQASAPIIGLIEGDQATDEKRWMMVADGKSFEVRTATDAGGSGVTGLRITRGTGTAVASASFTTAVLAPTFQSTAATGTAPFTVASSTLIPNLNADMVDGMQPTTASTANSLAARNASGDLGANVLVSTVATGKAPLTVASTTLVPNLNADMVGGVRPADLKAKSVVILSTNADTSLSGVFSNSLLDSAGVASIVLGDADLWDATNKELVFPRVGRYLISGFVSVTTDSAWIAGDNIEIYFNASSNKFDAGTNKIRYLTTFMVPISGARTYRIPFSRILHVPVAGNKASLQISPQRSCILPAGTDGTTLHIEIAEMI